MFYTSFEFPFIKRTIFEPSIIDDFSLYENRNSLNQVILYLVFNHLKWLILFYLILISVISSFKTLSIIYGVLLFVSFKMLFNNSKLNQNKNILWKTVIYCIYLVILSSLIFQTPIFPCPVNRDDRFYLGLDECIEEEKKVNNHTGPINEIYSKTGIDALYMLILQIIGFSKQSNYDFLSKNLHIFIVFVASLFQKLIF